MSRQSSVRYDRSSHIASEAGPSRLPGLPNFSQILDLDMKDILDMPLSDDQFSSNEQNTPKTTTTPTTTRSDNPAAVLRALLSRLPAHPPSPTKSHALSVQGSTEQERESDFDTVSESNVAPSIAQESLKHIFSNALRDPGNTPIKTNSFRISKHSNGHHHNNHSHTDISHNDTSRTDNPNLRPTSPSPSPPVSFSKEPNGLPSTRVMTPASSRKQETPRNEDSVCDPDIESDGLRETDFSSQSESPKLWSAHSFQNPVKTPKPPGGWVSTPAPAPIPGQSMPVDSPLDNPERNQGLLTPVALFSKGSKLDIPERNQGLLTPVASFSKGSKIEPKTPAAPGAWLATPAVKKSILKVRFEPEVSTLTDKSESGKHPDPSYHSSISGINGLDDGDDSLQRTEELSSKPPPSPRRQKSLKSPKIRVLDAFGREQEPDLSNQERVNGSPSALRVVDAMGHLIGDVEDTEAAATPSCSTVSRGELLSRIRNGLDDLVVGLDDLDKGDQPLSIDHDRVQQLTTISSRARGLREKLYSQANSSHSSLSSTKASWFSANRKVYIFLIILQLSLTWLVYRISINRAQELWLNRYYDPFNPELHVYNFKSDAPIHVLRLEGTRTTAWSSLVGYIWDGWICFIGNIQFRFWQTWDNRYDNAWTPT